MILILGKTLIYWTGILAGFLFLLSFFGCRCINFRWLDKCKFINYIRKNHKAIIAITFFAVLIHAFLAVLAGSGIYI